MNSLTKVFSGKHARINLRVEETLTGAVLTMRINEQDEAFVSKNESDEKKFQASNGVKIKSHSHPALQFVRFGSKQILTVFLRGRNKIDGGDFATMDVNSYNDGKYLLEHILLALDEWDASFDKISNKEASTIKEVFKLIADAQEDMNQIGRAHV